MSALEQARCNAACSAIERPPVRPGFESRA
jgi:hypothetical protein